MGERIVPGCEGCLKIQWRLGMKTCSVFKDPAYQHRDGRKCFGYTCLAKDMSKIYNEMADYAELPKVQREFRAEAKKWDIESRKANRLKKEE